MGERNVKGIRENRGERVRKQERLKGRGKQIKGREG